MRARVFEQQLSDLFKAPVEGMTADEKMALIMLQAEAILHGLGGERWEMRFEPFVPGRRPDDEVLYPGLGSSTEVGLFNRDRLSGAPLKLLLRCSSGGEPMAGPPASAGVFATIEAIDADGDPLGVVPGWDRRDVTTILQAPESGPVVSPVPRALVLAIDLHELIEKFSPLGPSSTVLGFGELFHQRFRVSVDVEVGRARITGDDFVFEVHNDGLYGSLYQRLVDVLLPHDVAQQCESKGVPPLAVSAHPWFPVLCIGMQKARFYMDAIIGDLVEQDRMLTDPGWLLRVGLYLEYLTCVGIAEAVKGDIDILTPEERERFEQSPVLAEIRDRIDVDAWKDVWRLREMALSRKGAAGSLNLLRKKTATFAFLHAHHEDLKNAIDLAGPNLNNAQETWHRVFRDAERAVLQMNRDAFPELGELPAVAREFALWHESGSLVGLRLMPRQVTELFGDQDGVFPSACRQYRASMNYVADWARDLGLMEFTGDECVPKSASLLEAHMTKQPARLARLQRRDGYAGSIDVRHESQVTTDIDRNEILESLQRVELLAALSVDELQQLALVVRPISLGHLERIIVQGREGSSLFILQEGTLEVITRVDSSERQVAVLQPPALVGELAFLVGEKRSATVRAIEQATVLELGAAQLRPFVEARPALLDGLVALLEERRRRNLEPAVSGRLLDRVRRAIFAAATT